MKELSYSHSPFRREQCVCVLTDRNNYLLYTGSAAGGAGTERARQGSPSFPYSHTHTTPEMTQARSLGAPWSHMPWETPMAQARLGTPFLTSHWVQTSQRGSGADGNMVSGVWRAWARAQRGPGKEALCPSFGLMKTSVASERLLVLTGILI